jgi:hypothetical protein
MTRDQAAALCQLLHIEMGNRAFAFYATARLYGHDLLNSTSQLEQCGWRDYESPLGGGYTNAAWTMQKKASKMFRDMADALDVKEG